MPKQKEGTEIIMNRAAKRNWKRYEECATRLENRSDIPPSKEYVDRLVKALDAAGVEAFWNAAVDPRGRAFFPSKVYPRWHPEASLEAFHYLINRLHESGRPVLSWYSMHQCIGLVEEHPDWAMKPVPAPGLKMDCSKDRPNTDCCFNSPYGEILPKFAVEIVETVGFDGIWFDGSAFALYGNTYPGCSCDYCKERFKRDTGLEFPTRWDFEDKTFRDWIIWRYDILMDVWKRVVEAVKSVRPDAVVCFNNYRRRTGGAGLGWNTGIPLRTLDMDALMSSELDGFPGQADIQMKINKAYKCRRGVETWWCLFDYWHAHGADVEELPAVQAALGCISAGGVASCGVAVAVEEVVSPLREMQNAASVRMPYVGGETVEYAAILASQATMDFFGKEKPITVWNGIHGANEILRHAHLLTSVVFDDQLQADTLKKYPVLILGNAACFSKEQASELKVYVEAGGVIFACAEVGMFDEMGYAHSPPVLDDLIGIKERTTTGYPLKSDAVSCYFENSQLKDVCGPCITLEGIAFNIAAHDDVEVIANGTTRKGNNIKPEPYGPVLWKKQTGKGCLIYCTVDLFSLYLRAPTHRLMRMVQVLLSKTRRPAVTLEGPMCVTMNVRETDPKIRIVHLHNTPGSTYLYLNYFHMPGEVVPVGPITIVVQDTKILKATSGLTGKVYDVQNQSRVLIPKLELHDVVCLHYE